MSRKHVARCDVCGRPVARDAVVKLTVAGRRGPDVVDWLQTVGPLAACPVCARTRRFRVVADESPPPASAGPDGGPAGPWPP